MISWASFVVFPISWSGLSSDIVIIFSVKIKNKLTARASKCNHKLDLLFILPDVNTTLLADWQVFIHWLPTISGARLRQNDPFLLIKRSTDGIFLCFICALLLLFRSRQPQGLCCGYETVAFQRFFQSPRHLHEGRVDQVWQKPKPDYAKHPPTQGQPCVHWRCQGCRLQGLQDHPDVGAEHLLVAGCHPSKVSPV